MLFNSYPFVFVFLPFVLAGFAVLARWRTRRAVLTFLIVASLAFYAWWDWRFLSLIVFSIVFNFSLGTRLQRRARPLGASAGPARRLLALGVGVNLGWLLDAGPYWDFSGVGMFDAMDSLFLDVAHFWPAVGHVMLREFLGQGCGKCGAVAEMIRNAGVLVDPANIDAHLAQHETMRTAARSRRDRCATVVEEMLPRG